jgi:hypothetical protein
MGQCNHILILTDKKRKERVDCSDQCLMIEEGIPAWVFLSPQRVSSLTMVK